MLEGANVNGARMWCGGTYDLLRVDLKPRNKQSEGSFPDSSISILVYSGTKTNLIVSS